MLRPVNLRVEDAHIPDLSTVNRVYWTHDFEKRELEARGYVCLNCGNIPIFKMPYLDEETGSVAWH